MTIDELVEQPNFAEAMGLVIYIGCGATYPEIMMSLIDKENYCGDNKCTVSGIDAEKIARDAGNYIINKI